MGDGPALTLQQKQWRMYQPDKDLAEGFKSMGRGLRIRFFESSRRSMRDLKDGPSGETGRSKDLWFGKMSMLDWLMKDVRKASVRGIAYLHGTVCFSHNTGSHDIRPS